MIRGEKRDMSQLITSNNSMKTNPLKYRQDRREKRYVVVTHSLTHKIKTHQLKDGKRERYVVVTHID